MEFTSGYQPRYLRAPAGYVRVRLIILGEYLVVDWEGDDAETVAIEFTEFLVQPPDDNMNLPFEWRALPRTYESGTGIVVFRADLVASFEVMD